MRITKENIHEFIDGTIMNCNNIGVIHIEYIPDHIKNLYCSDNKLTSLPKLPDGLIRLNCYSNNLTSLPKLPDGLKHLYCDFNKLTKLPKLPDRLLYLDCSFNNLPYEITIHNYKEKHNKLLKRKKILSKICV